MADQVINITLGDDGRAWCVDSALRLWFWSGVAWTQPNPGTFGRQISAAHAQLAWYVNDKGEVFQRTVDHWTPVNPVFGAKNLMWIDVAADTTLWAVDRSQQIWTRTGTAWNQPNPTARAVQVAVGSRQHVWVVNIAGEVYTRQVDRWIQPDQKLRASHISVGADGAVMYIGKTDGQIYRRTGNTWTVEPRGSFKQVSVRSAAHWWALSAVGEIWAMVNDQFSRVPSPNFPVKKTYTVKGGDTLVGIAIALKVDYAQLLKANPQITNPNQIREGQTLSLPEV